MHKRLIERLEAYYNKNKSESVYFYPLALLYFKSKQNDKAYQILIDGLQRYPRYALALVLIGRILIEEGNYDAAVAYLETAANIQKTNVKALELLAESYEHLGKTKEAVDVYEKLLKIEEKEQYKDKLLKLSQMVQPPEEDVEKIVEEMDSEPDIPKIELEETEEGEEEEEVTVTLAKLYEKQGYIEDAIDVYKKILKKEPDNEEAKEALNRLLVEDENEKED